MYSFAYLAALKQEMLRFQERDITFSSDKLGRLFIYSGSERQEVYYQKYQDWKEIPPEDPNLTERINCSQELLALEPVKNFESALGLLIVEEDLEQLIESAFIKEGQVLYQVGNTSKTVSIDESLTEDVLIAAHCVRRGYIIREVAGRHLLIKSPTGLKYATTAYSCTCTNFSEKRDCSHLRLAKTVMSYTNVFYKHKVVRLL